jgi:hypothetical protein
LEWVLIGLALAAVIGIGLYFLPKSGGRGRKDEGGDGGLTVNAAAMDTTPRRATWDTDGHGDD